MNRKSFLILFNIFAVILQTSFLPEIFGNSLSPNVIASVVLALLISGDTELAFISALFGGLLLDLVSSGILGLGTFALVVFVWIYSHISSFYLRSFTTRLVFSTLSFYALHLLVARTIIFDSNLFTGVLLTAILGQIFALFLKGHHEKINL